jgi:hypothetical protein
MTEPTTEKLAKAMEAAGAPEELIKAARAGVYDDYKSCLTFPCVQLVEDLRAAGLEDLAQRAINDEFGGTPEEAEAWMEAEGKHHLPPAMVDAIRGKRSKPKGFG